MSDRMKTIEKSIDTWFEKQDAIPIINLGSICGLSTMRKLIVMNQQAISKLVSGLDGVNEAEEDTLIRAEAVSDTLSIAVNYIDDLIRDSMEDVPLEEEDILFYINSILDSIPEEDEEPV